MSVINPRGSNVSWGAAEAGVPPAAGDKPRDNADIRNSYNDKVTSAYEDSFRARFQEFHDNEQCFGDELAREAFDARTKIKEAHQAETSLLGRVAIWFRNVFTYGAGNATYEGLSKTKNPEELAYSAFKSDKGTCSPSLRPRVNGAINMRLGAEIAPSVIGSNKVAVMRFPVIKALL
mgnify:CR=1 FL=1